MAQRSLARDWLCAFLAHRLGGANAARTGQGDAPARDHSRFPGDPRDGIGAILRDRSARNKLASAAG